MALATLASGGVRPLAAMGPGKSAVQLASEAKTQQILNGMKFSTSQPAPAAPAAPQTQVQQIQQTQQPQYNAAAVAAAQQRAQMDLAANPLLASLGSLDQILGNRLGNAQSTYDRFINQYNEQDALDRQAYDGQVQSNNENLASDRQAGLLNAARGGVGLRSVLSSMGALAGSGSDLISRLIGQAANSDIGQADKTFKTNSSNLNTSWGQAEQQQRQRRSDAGANLQNDQQNARADVLNSRKSIFEQLANVYGTADAKGTQYASQAAALAPQIANTTRASVAPYQAASSLFSPGALQQYLAGTKDLNVNTSGSTQTPINSPTFAATQRKDDRLSGVA